MYRRRSKRPYAPLSRWQRLWRGLRWWLGAAILIVILQVVQQRWQPALAPLQGTRLNVSLTFYRCGAGRGPNCVPDGDTLIMGQRKIRIIGIDAPEAGDKAGCPEEAVAAEAAAEELLRLLKQGSFLLQPPQDGLRDQYGRELMTLTRTRADGTTQDLAEDLIASGKVHRFDRGSPRGGWC